MRESSDGRDAVPPRCDTFSIGDRVYGTLDEYPGTVTAVGARTVTIHWRDGKFPVELPETVLHMIRRALPWE